MASMKGVVVEALNLIASVVSIVSAIISGAAAFKAIGIWKKFNAIATGTTRGSRSPVQTVSGNSNVQVGGSINVGE